MGQPAQPVYPIAAALLEEAEPMKGSIRACFAESRTHSWGLDPARPAPSTGTCPG